MGILVVDIIRLTYLAILALTLVPTAVADSFPETAPDCNFPAADLVREYSLLLGCIAEDKTVCIRFYVGEVCSDILCVDFDMKSAEIGNPNPYEVVGSLVGSQTDPLGIRFVAYGRDEDVAGNPEGAGQLQIGLGFDAMNFCLIGDADRDISGPYAWVPTINAPQVV